MRSRLPSLVLMIYFPLTKLQIILQRQTCWVLESWPLYWCLGEKINEKTNRDKFYNFSEAIYFQNFISLSKIVPTKLEFLQRKGCFLCQKSKGSFHLSRRLLLKPKKMLVNRWAIFLLNQNFAEYFYLNLIDNIMLTGKILQTYIVTNI